MPLSRLIILFTFVPYNSESGSVPAQIAETFLESTVKIVSVASDGSVSEGSGFVLDETGYILTNLHVINTRLEKNQNAGLAANASCCRRPSSRTTQPAILPF